MNDRLKSFLSKFANTTAHKQIEEPCDKCGAAVTAKKTRAQQTIQKRGEYLCRSCAMERKHVEHPFSEEAKAKIADSHRGREKSDETKQKMSLTRKALFQTPYGSELKKALSKKAAKQHAERNVETTRRRGVYPSKKNDDYMVFGSSYELRAIINLENDPQVERYQTQVYFEIGDRHRSMDLLIFYRENPIPLSVEVKAKERLSEVKVIEQIADGRAWAASQGYPFEVWTEEDLGFSSPHEATRWADKILSKRTSIDFEAVRRDKNREKANRHYQSKLKDQKVEVYCQFCKGTHTLREEQHLDNIEKNGRYICHAENAVITGKQPKDHLKKENPYAAEGKKKCNGECGEIKLLTEFGDDKSRRDGKATQCKACRAKKATAKYQAEKKPQQD